MICRGLTTVSPPSFPRCVVAPAFGKRLSDQNRLSPLKKSCKIDEINQEEKSWYFRGKLVDWWKPWKSVVEEKLAMLVRKAV